LALVELSKIPFGQSIKIGEIAKRQRIPQRFLEVILSQLKHGGVVDSKRGADGGYQLARPASQITVSKIFSILGTERKVTEEHSDPMLVPARFILVNLWNKVDKAVDEILDSTTIEHLATEEERMRLGTSPMYII
jgi:Rrf2 family protein